MARPCTICTHRRRAEIEAAAVGPEPNRRVATRFGVAEASLRRHVESHLPQALVKSAEAREEAHGDGLARRVAEAEADAHRLRDVAEKQGDVRAALGAVKLLLDVVGLLYRTAEKKEISDRELTERFLESKDWHEIKEVMVTALAPFPEASEAVAVALERHDK